MLNHSFKVILGLSVSLFFDQAIAHEPRAIMLDNNPSFCDMYRGLSGNNDVPDFCPPLQKKRITRGSVRPIEKTQTIAFSKLINFEYDSSELMPQSHETLNKLLAVLKYEKMISKVIRIEGHTDIIGTAEYNKHLSKRRALAVKHYLVKRGVEANRLQTVGYGFKRLYDRDHPDDGINRRVEFVNLGG
jgi:outer membrane protein OmpA-like peptidoglycan-associated protein